eukprot:m51a1_g11557 hypothetical protein (85) ;mRNA; f:176-8211
MNEEYQEEQQDDQDDINWDDMTTLASMGPTDCFSSPSKYFHCNNVMSMPEMPEVFTISWTKRSFLKQFKVETTYLNRWVPVFPQ